MRHRLPVFRLEVRHLERHHAPSHRHLASPAVNLGRIERRPDRREHRPLQPRCRLARIVERGLHVHSGNRMEVIELDVVFAAPDHLHRLAGFLREHRGLDRIVRLRFAPKPSAQERNVTGDVLLLQAERLSYLFLHALRILRRRPHRHLLTLHVSDGDRRLHGSMRQMRREVLCLHDLAALGKLSIRIAHSVHDLSRLARRLLQFLLIFSRVVRSVAPVVPLNLEILPAFERGKRVVSDHRHATQRLKRMGRFKRIDRNCLLHSDHFQSRGVINRLHLPTEHRRMSDGGIKHPVDPHVHPKQRLP